MGEYVGPDVSLQSTSVHIVNEHGRCVWRGKCPTDIAPLASTIRKRAPEIERVGHKTGMLANWLWHGLAERRLPVVCMDARQAKAALSIKINKTDTNDAEGLAKLLRTGFFREVRVKAKPTMLVRTLLTARRQLVRTGFDLANQIHGLLKIFDLLLPKGGARIFKAAVLHAILPGTIPQVRAHLRSPGNGPEMLDPAGPELEWLNAQPHLGSGDLMPLSAARCRCVSITANPRHGPRWAAKRG